MRSPSAPSRAVERAPRTDRDPFAPELAGAPHAVFAELGPVVWCAPRSCWLVGGHRAVREGLRDTETFSSAHGIGERPVLAVNRPNLLTTDPPEHGPLRREVDQVFHATALVSLEGSIAERCERLLDEALEKPGFDLVADYAVRLPASVIGGMLGVPATDVESLMPWIDTVVTTIDVGEVQDTVRIPLPEAFHRLEDLFRELIARGRAGDATPTLRALIDALDAGRLTEIGALTFCTLLFVAGAETTVNLIGSAALRLLDGDRLSELAHDTATTVGAVEETLRCDPPLRAVFRTAARDVAVEGARVQAGDRVGLFIAAANRDPARFTNPDTFDPTRSPNPHLAFAHGVHHCLGAALARLEARIALRTLAQRAPGLRRTTEGPPRRGPNRILHGPAALPVRA